MKQTPLLEIKNVACSFHSTSPFGSRKRRTRVLDDVSFSLLRGGTTALLGESGSGKSTLARCIGGLQQADSGEILFDGLNVFPSIRNREQISLQIQLLFQATGASLNPMLTIEKSINEGIEASGNLQTAAQLMKDVGLEPELLKRFPSQISGGQKQRVALARALAAKPKLLILDEPTSALDILTQKQILSLLKIIQREHNLALLFITHDVRTALAFCDRVAVLHDGRIVEENFSKELLGQQQHSYTRQIFSDSGISS